MPTVKPWAPNSWASAKAGISAASPAGMTAIGRPAAGGAAIIRARRSTPAGQPAARLRGPRLAWRLGRDLERRVAVIIEPAHQPGVERECDAGGGEAFLDALEERLRGV